MASWPYWELVTGLLPLGRPTHPQLLFKPCHGASLQCPGCCTVLVSSASHRGVPPTWCTTGVCSGVSTEVTSQQGPQGRPWLNLSCSVLPFPRTGHSLHGTRPSGSQGCSAVSIPALVCPSPFSISYSHKVTIHHSCNWKRAAAAASQATVHPPEAGEALKTKKV